MQLLSIQIIRYQSLSVRKGSCASAVCVSGHASIYIKKKTLQKDIKQMKEHQNSVVFILQNISDHMDFFLVLDIWKRSKSNHCVTAETLVDKPFSTLTKTRNFVKQ